MWRIANPPKCAVIMVAKEKYITKFKELYMQKNGKEISDDFAMEYFEKLIMLVRAIYRPMPRRDYEEYIKKYER